MKIYQYIHCHTKQLPKDVFVFVFAICTFLIDKMLVDTITDTIEFVEKQTTFSEKYRLYGQVTPQIFRSLFLTNKKEIITF